MNTFESTGKSVDEAIFKGLQQMGISIDEVTIEILRTETKGILGIGAKPAIVRLTRKPAEEINVSELFAEKQKSFSENRGRDRDRGNRNPRKDKPREDKREKQDANARPPKPEKVQRQEAKPEKKPAEIISREIIHEGDGELDPAKPEVIEETTSHIRDAKEPREVKEEKPRRDRAPRDNRQRRQEKQGDEAKPAPAEAPAPEAPEKVIEYTLEAAQGNPAAEFVQGLIEHMGATGQVLAAQDEDCLRLRIDSEMMGMLIGHRGETLDAMQYLTGLVVNKNRKTEGYIRVTLNTEEYREKREETLKRLAKKVAAQVRASGKPRVLEPMNPYERRVLHSTLQNNPDVTTHSEGEEPNRRVVVTPKRKGRSGYTKSRGSRRNTERRAPRAEAPADSENDTISREEYERLYEAAKAASPMFMNRPSKDE